MLKTFEPHSPRINPVNPNRTEGLASSGTQDDKNIHPSPSVSQDTRRSDGSSDGLFRDPGLDTAIDFGSQEGLIHQAKKKGKKPAAAAPTKPTGDNNDDKKDGSGSGNGNSGEQGSGEHDTAGNGNASGAGDGGDGDGNKGKGNDGADAGNGDGGWDDLTDTKGKKKKGKNEPEIGGIPEPAPDPPGFGGDAFDEIKLGDDIGGKLDLNFGSTDTDTKGGFASWGTSWKTGGSGWGWSGSSTKAADKKEEIDLNPWGGKTKAKPDDLGFGSIGEIQEKVEEQPKGAPGDSWGWATSAQNDKKKPTTATAQGNGKKDEPDLWDSWGGSNKKKNALDEFSTDDPSAGAGSGSGPLDDFWGSSNKKDKLAESETVPAKKEDDSWGFSSEPPTKKDTKKKKKASMFDEPLLEETKAEAPKTDNLWGWGLAGSKDKEKKKGSADLIELDDPGHKPPTEGLIERTGDDDFFNSWGTGNKDKSNNNSIEGLGEATGKTV